MAGQSARHDSIVASTRFRTKRGSSNYWVWVASFTLRSSKTEGAGFPARSGQKLGVDMSRCDSGVAPLIGSSAWSREFRCPPISLHGPT